MGQEKRKIVVLIGLALVLFLGWKALTLYGLVPSLNFPAVNPNEWQAVFLTNNQVYFGHLKSYNRGYALLTDIFYLQAANSLQQGSPPQAPGFNLVKLGSEIHGPKDTMYVPKDKILYWENLKDDSQVVQAINNFLANQ